MMMMMMMMTTIYILICINVSITDNKSTKSNRCKFMDNYAIEQSSSSSPIVNRLMSLKNYFIVNKFHLNSKTNTRDDI